MWCSWWDAQPAIQDPLIDRALLENSLVLVGTWSADTDPYELVACTDYRHEHYRVEALVIVVQSS